MTEQDLRDMLADEFERNGMKDVADRVRGGYDNSDGGTAALAAMKKPLEKLQPAGSST
jgi:hypothetical protein